MEGTMPKKLNLKFMALAIRTEALKEASRAEWTREEKQAFSEATEGEPSQMIKVVLTYCE
jgi:hypothetical protein